MIVYVPVTRSADDCFCLVEVGHMKPIVGHTEIFRWSECGKRRVVRAHLKLKVFVIPRGVQIRRLLDHPRELITLRCDGVRRVSIECEGRWGNDDDATRVISIANRNSLIPVYGVPRSCH